ncbi:hypothetical protein LINPERPRIM_LOCUS28525 [Linum perenne]
MGAYLGSSVGSSGEPGTNGFSRPKLQLRQKFTPKLFTGLATLSLNWRISNVCSETQPGSLQLKWLGILVKPVGCPYTRMGRQIGGRGRMPLGVYSVISTAAASWHTQ